MPSVRGSSVAHWGRVERERFREVVRARVESIMILWLLLVVVTERLITAGNEIDGTIDNSVSVLDCKFKCTAQ